MLRDIAGEDPSLDGLEEPIHERTAGNPFFVEEIVRELVEAGHFEGERGAYRLVRPVEEAGVPATVQAVLAARIDRLSPVAKQLLQIISVLGKEVGARSLGLTAELNEEELDPALCELVDGGFLYEAELYPERVLAFRHPLTREVAYGTQLAEHRAATHAAAARAMIELEPDRLDELAALVAHHMEEGDEALEAARWSARAAYWAGTASRARRCASGAGRWSWSMGWMRARRRRRWQCPPACYSCIRLAPRHGQERGSAAGQRGGGDRDAHRRPALAGPAASSHRRPARHATTSADLAHRGRGGHPARRRIGRPALRIAMRGVCAYALSAPATSRA